MKHVQIRIPGSQPGSAGEILVDGEPMHGVTGVEFTQKTVRDIPRVTLHLAAFPVEIDAGVTLHISDETRATLIDFGWQPPLDTEVGE